MMIGSDSAWIRLAEQSQLSATASEWQSASLQRPTATGTQAGSCHASALGFPNPHRPFSEKALLIVPVRSLVTETGVGQARGHLESSSFQEPTNGEPR